MDEKKKKLTLLGLGLSLQTADRKKNNKKKILFFKWSLFLLLYSYTETSHIAFKASDCLPIVVLITKSNFWEETAMLGINALRSTEREKEKKNTFKLAVNWLRFTSTKC